MAIQVEAPRGCQAVFGSVAAHWDSNKAIRVLCASQSSGAEDHEAVLQGTE